MSFGTEPDAVRAALVELFARDPAAGVGTAFDILAREPRIKPSRGLLIDPTNGALRRWRQRVSAGAALVASASLADVYDEVLAELSDCTDLAAEVLTVAAPHPDLPARLRADLLALHAG